MKQLLPIAVVMAGTLLGTGCATKKYVRKTVDPVSGKLDQVATKSDEQGKTLDQTRQDLDKTTKSAQATQASLEKDETALSATNERALSADNKAGQAMTRAEAAGQSAEKANQGVGELRTALANTIANLDEYKQVGQSTVNFKFNSDKLSDEAKMSLDQMVANPTQYKRFFIAVEGFTDATGSTDYNAALSRRRADAVVEYMVAQHNIPIYRIHMVGLGKQKPVEEGRSAAARAKNRRVEVTLFSADQSLALK